MGIGRNGVAWGKLLRMDWVATGRFNPSFKLAMISLAISIRLFFFIITNLLW